MVPRFGPPGDIGFCSGGDGPGVAPAEAFVPVGGTVTFAVRLASAAPQTITATILVAGGALGTFPATITFPEGTTIQNFTYTAVEPGDDHLVVLGPDATVLGTAQVRATR